MTTKTIPLKDGLPLTSIVCSILISAIKSFRDVNIVTPFQRATLTRQLFEVVADTARVWPGLIEKDWKQIRFLAPEFGYDKQLEEKIAKNELQKKNGKTPNVLDATLGET